MLTVLIVDDQSYELQKYQKFVEGLGCEVIPAPGGREAVTILMPFDGSEAPLFDAIITDTRMGEFSGINLLQFVSRTGHKGHDAPPPTLLHSSDPTFRMGKDEIDLAQMTPEIFPFAQFHLKGEDLAYIKEFLDKIA